MSTVYIVHTDWEYTCIQTVTFMLDWKVARKYPAVILFYINGCFFIATLGWLAQFTSREDVICRKDGTIRTGEPLIGSGETASCTVVFILIYYFVMAGVVWFVMLAYSWDIHFKALGTVRDDLSKKTAYFHIISWCLPLVLTIVCLSISVIDADSLSGICFPGFYDSRIRTGFVLAPIGIALVVGAFFSIRGLLTLIKVKKDSPPFIGEKATAKIHDTIIRLGVFIVLTFILVIFTTCIHVYTFVKSDDWNKSLMDFTYCKANVSVMQILDNAAPSSCEMESRPSLSAAMINVFAFFFAGIVFSSWSWTKASLEVWERLYRRLCNKPSNRPQKLRKHRMVARAFKRQKKRSNERLSISYGTDHDDPVGMRFDRSSASSHSQSSGFAVSMPKHSRRHLRGMMRPGRSRHRHVDSDAISLGSRHSRSSRRQSYESSMSQKLSDIEREIREEERRKRRRKRRKKRQNRIQPILEPISSNMAAIQAHRLKQMNRHFASDSSDVSRLSSQPPNVGFNKNFIPMQSLGSSNILSDSVTTGNSISEIELPQTKQKLPDFSIFTTQAALPPTANKEENKEDNSNGNTSNLKGANPSPSGSYRRGRRREVKLEMTETSFYQEDEDNIEMGGNQTIHTEENLRETGEIRGNLKELGPLVNEIFEQARANSNNSRNSSHRDVMGSGRLGSASSRGSKGSRASQSNSKDIKYATTKVNLPPEMPRPDTDRTDRKRPFSGNYVLDQRRNNAKRDEGVRKSQSQPGSRVSSATNHKRQIGHNGRLDLGDGLSWSRFLHTKGHAPGQLFDPMEAYSPSQKCFYNPPIVFDKRQGPYPGQLQIMDKKHFEVQDPIVSPQEEKTVPNLEQECKQNHTYEMQRPYTNPYRKYETMGDVLPDDVEAEDSGISSRLSQVQPTQGVNILNVEAEHCKHCGAHKNFSQNVDLLNIQEEQIKSDISSEPTVNLDMLNVEEEHRKHSKKKPSSPSKVLTGKKEKEKLRQSPKKTADVLDIEAEQRNELGKTYDLSEARGLGDTFTKDTNMLNIDQEQLERAKHGDVLANVCDLNDPKVDKQCPKIIEQIQRPHTGPGPASDEQPKVRGKHDFIGAFSGKAQKSHVVPNKTKTVATLNSNVMTDSKSKGKQGSNKSVPVANMNVLTLEQQRQQLKQKLGSQGSLSSGSRSASRSGSATTGSASSRNSRLKMLQQNSAVLPESNKTHSNSKLNKIINQKPASGLERNLGMFDFIDYEEFNSEYDDVTTDDLTDTYTYTDYDDDLTEVSSLPC
ncbi:protein smoothened-like isoform X2 [Ruditapes philippinarum]|uniref:protein smoothened-like isoform X2 n=1 Tax=Ruditapes philippinarum TaxID=129788 RepID=UPI00295A7113|nr:protein smoothened-like isoform X2 [Ruditapes philippinarum]